jgi:hypothetical protein
MNNTKYMPETARKLNFWAEAEVIEQIQRLAYAENRTLSGQIRYILGKVAQEVRELNPGANA